MIRLNSFELEEFDYKNIEHRITMINIFNDMDVSNTIGVMDKFIDNIYEHKTINNYNCIYIVKYNNEYIGFISLYELDSKTEICYSILPGYRKNGLATKVLKEFSEYTFNNTELNELYLYINKSNIGSIKVAINNGYVKTTSVEYQKKR